MAGFYMPQRQMPTVKDFDSPHTISIINEIAYDWDDSTSIPFASSFLPSFFEAFRHHLSTANIPSDDDYNTDLPLIRACFTAFAKGVPDLYGEEHGTTKLWKDILSMTDTILSWTRYFFRSFDISISIEESPDIGGIPDKNLSCIAPLLSTLIQNEWFRFTLYSEPHFIENVARFWLHLTLRGYQSAYEMRALMATLTSFDERIEEMSEIVRSRYEIEDVATVVMQGIIEAQSRQPQKYIDYARSGKLLAFCTLVSDDIFNCLVARKSIMWSCRAIRTLVSKPKRYSPSEARIRMVGLQHLLGIVSAHSQSYVYNFTEALDFHLLESVLMVNHFISLNKGSLGAGMTPPMTFDVLVRVLDGAATLSVYRSVLRQILRAVKHAKKFKSTRGQERVVQSWYRLKALALEREKDMHRYDVEENNGRFLCENQECPNKRNTSRTSSRRCGGCLNVMYCSPECQKIDWKAIPGHRLSCLENQLRRKDGKSYGISRIDLEFCFAKCRDDIRAHLNLIRALRTQDLNEQAEKPDPVATTIVMSYCGPGNGVRMLRKDISTCAALVGEDKWLSAKKAGEDVIIVMEIPSAGDQSHYAFPLSESGITL
ncbi:hypothetical protein EV421DRAFT_164086 [Armillaria borealis]|uniref:MYND-type domain-containing protein n=1 Tax=Armillaria borealis TaxID=47425 RepID=A0AA39IXD1_9AGAR|nr:hypothetical protein EV421DRAFT_164086 [Armillaria borealis]